MPSIMETVVSMQIFLNFHFNQQVIQISTKENNACTKGCICVQEL